jgi:MFS family permease
LTATIYFPLIELLAHRYSVSTEAINLTITLYLVFQGIVPSIFSPLSDSWGRRPVYLLAFVIFTASSLGLSIVDRNYPALLVLRAFQSIGSSAAMSLAYGTVSDVVLHSRRGSYLAPMLTTTNFGQWVGPVIGGGLTFAAGDPRWCFRALLIFGASSTLLIGWVMPETGRNIVGNGAVPPQGIWMTWWAFFTSNRVVKSIFSILFAVNGQIDQPSRPSEAVQENNNKTAAESELAMPANVGKTGRGKFVFPNPWPSIKIVFYRDTFLVLWLAGCPSAILFCMQTSISPIFTHIYGFNPLQIGLCFLAGGAGVLAAGFVSGKLMDHNYKHVAIETGFPIDRVRGDDISNFPIERARTRGSITIVAASMLVVVGYGWVVEKAVHPSVPLIFQAYIGCKCATLHQIYGALIVDIFPDRPATAAASKNITRCALAGVFVAVLDPLVRLLGYGLCFTLLGVIDALTCVVAIVVLNRWGKIWRNRRT